MSHSSMKNKQLTIISMTCFVLLSSVAQDAFSANKMTTEELENSLSVTTRTNKSLDPLGVQVGTLDIKPSVNASGRYMDNVYSSPSNKKSDTVYVIEPRISASTNWERHALNAAFSLENGTYAKTSEENYLDYGTNIGGRYDFTKQTSLPVVISYSHDHSRRTSPDDRLYNKPTEFDVLGAEAGLQHKGQTIAGQIGTKFQKFTLSDNAIGNTVVNNADRNHTEFTTSGRIGMAREGYFVPYVYSSYKDVSYEDTMDDNGQDRNSTEVESGIGSQINLSAITYSDISVGYASRDMESGIFPNVNALLYKAKITWEPSTLAAFSLQGARTVEETSLKDFSVSVDDSIRANLLYEITPFLFLRPQVEYLQKSYEGLGTGELNQWLESIGLNYKINRNVWTSLSYANIHQTVGSDSPQLAGFDSNIVYLTFKFQM